MLVMSFMAVVLVSLLVDPISATLLAYPISDVLRVRHHSLSAVLKAVVRLSQVCSIAGHLHQSWRASVKTPELVRLVMAARTAVATVMGSCGAA